MSQFRVSVLLDEAEARPRRSGGAVLAVASRILLLTFKLISRSELLVLLRSVVRKGVTSHRGRWKFMHPNEGSAGCILLRNPSESFRPQPNGTKSCERWNPRIEFVSLPNVLEAL